MSIWPISNTITEHFTVILQIDESKCNPCLVNELKSSSCTNYVFNEQEVEG